MKSKVEWAESEETVSISSESLMSPQGPRDVFSTANKISHLSSVDLRLSPCAKSTKTRAKEEKKCELDSISSSSSFPGLMANFVCLIRRLKRKFINSDCCR